VARGENMDINEKIILSEYDANWVNQFDDEKKILQIHFPSIYVEHIGSTSIEGMIAKPIIDMLIGIEFYPTSDEMVTTFEGLGYNSFGENSKLPDRLYLAKRGVVNYNIHITEYMGKFWNHIISFREYLKTHEDIALEYKKIKRSIISKGINTMIEYSKEKGDFIANIIEKMNNVKN
jgi:GrpB-like predicted nucleotidyltransferase (UPF0157 family)